jgi:hypothetical protein
MYKRGVLISRGCFEDNGQKQSVCLSVQCTVNSQYMLNVAHSCIQCLVRTGLWQDLGDAR